MKKIMMVNLDMPANRAIRFFQNLPGICLQTGHSVLFLASGTSCIRELHPLDGP